MLQVVCSPMCAQTLAERKRLKQEANTKRHERAKVARAKESIKTIPQLTREAQTAFNAYIRYRDSGKCCISCGTQLPKEAVGGAYDCGHYRSVGSAPHLRFNEDNAHGQCKKCNRYGSGMAVDYRIGLIARIGLERVERLEQDNEQRRYRHDALRQIRDYYRQKLRGATKC